MDVRIIGDDIFVEGEKVAVIVSISSLAMDFRDAVDSLSGESETEVKNLRNKIEDVESDYCSLVEAIKETIEQYENLH